MKDMFRCCKDDCICDDRCCQECDKLRECTRKCEPMKYKEKIYTDNKFLIQKLEELAKEKSDLLIYAAAAKAEELTEYFEEKLDKLIEIIDRLID